MPGIINDLSVAATLFLRATGRKLLSKSDPEPDLEKYFSGMQGLLDRAPEGSKKHNEAHFAQRNCFLCVFCKGQPIWRQRGALNALRPQSYGQRTALLLRKWKHLL